MLFMISLKNFICSTQYYSYYLEPALFSNPVSPPCLKMNFVCKSLFFFALVVIMAVIVETYAEEETKPSDLNVKFQKAISDLNTTLMSAYEKLSDETKKNLQEASKKIEETVSTIKAKGMELYDAQITETKKA